MSTSTNNSTNQSDPTTNDFTTRDATPNASHPICQGAPDQDKCELFVERLAEASNNIDRRIARS